MFVWVCLCICFRDAMFEGIYSIIMKSFRWRRVCLLLICVWMKEIRVPVGKVHIFTWPSLWKISSFIAIA